MPFSTGLIGLDRLLRGLIPGDNLVWEVEAVEDMVPFVGPMCRHALAQGRQVVYFRFADHPPLVPEDVPVETCKLVTSAGFEQFITEIHRVFNDTGREACFVFDCLSTLAEDWLSDRMLGNFFRLACPYVFECESLAYFPILRNCHSFHALEPITDTTQIFLDVYRRKGELYLHPTKVQARYSPTMYMLHAWEGDEFVPVMESSTIAEILSATPWTGLDSVRLRQGMWNRTILGAERLREEICGGKRPAADADAYLARLLRMVVSRDPRVLALAQRYLTLDDVLAICSRMIGTGLIGGKSVGMLLARAILRQRDPRWNDVLEAHDSFFVGSDVFYSFLVENGCWWLRQKQRDPRNFLEGVEEVRRRIVTGTFPSYIEREFSEMLAHFGQSPIIVRSSSLLEDNYGNAFSGKYESVFCANQGPHQKRLADFLSAVRTVYASAMSEAALRYRAERGLLDRDEQMSLLVQRVSGTRYGHFYFPQVAGVGYSHNPYVWSDHIDPTAGMVRLVFGMGTRAVDRADDDYTRVVALNAPLRRPESDADEVRQYSQRKVDVIDLMSNQLVSVEFGDLAAQCPEVPIHLFATEDRQLADWAASREIVGGCTQVLTFEPLLTQTPFVGDLREILTTLQEAYQSPIDLEFAANFFAKDHYKVNLLQCRPLQVTIGGAAAHRPDDLAGAEILLEAHGAVIGASRLLGIDRIVYVAPQVYGQMPLAERYALARVIGKVMNLEPASARRRTLLIGPGRWGTKLPSLGVPVAFSEICRAAVLCEVVAMRDDLIPDVSLGTHFFNDLVEMDILYMALFPGRRGNAICHEFFDAAPNRLAELLPAAAGWSHVLKVIDASGAAASSPIRLYANSPEQTVVCYRRN